MGTGTSAGFASPPSSSQPRSQMHACDTARLAPWKPRLQAETKLRDIMAIRSKFIAMVSFGLLFGCSSVAMHQPNWLDACKSDDDCGYYRCVCGTCTHTCGSTEDCGAEGDAICATAEQHVCVDM